MKRWLAGLLALLTLLGDAALGEAAQGEFVFRNGVKWNMESSLVLIAEGEPEYEQSRLNAGITRRIDIAGVSAAGVSDVPLVYAFIGEKLVRAGYDFTGKDIDFDTLSRALTQVYGEPESADPERLALLDECIWGGSDGGDGQVAVWHGPQYTHIALIQDSDRLLLNYTDEPGTLALALLPPEGVWGMEHDAALARLNIDSYVQWEEDDTVMCRYESLYPEHWGPYPTLVFRDDALAMTMREFREEEYEIDVDALSALLTERYGERVDSAPERLFADMEALGIPYDLPEVAEGMLYLSWEGEDGSYVVLTNLYGPEDLALAIVGETTLPEPESEPEILNTEGL